MEINEIYPLQRLGFCTTRVEKQEDNIVINLYEIAVQSETVAEATQYQYDVLLLWWNRSKDPAQQDAQGTDWIDMGSKLHQFEFVFENTAGATHWLVCLHMVLGTAGKRLETMKAEGMNIAAVGSFDKKELALLKADQEVLKPGPVRGRGQGK